MSKASSAFHTRRLPDAYDVLAPDTSEIRVMGGVAKGSMAHGTLRPGGVSLAVTHRTVEEIWYVLSGAAEIWRKSATAEEVVTVTSGSSITIPVGTSFQFRTVSADAFCFIMCTMPPWPGEGEAIRVPDYWAGSTV